MHQNAALCGHGSSPLSPRACLLSDFSECGKQGAIFPFQHYSWQLVALSIQMPSMIQTLNEYVDKMPKPMTQTNARYAGPTSSELFWSLML